MALKGVAIWDVVGLHHACKVRVFGSVLRGEDTESGDLDILVDPTPETTLFDIGAIRHELGNLLGVSVDVLTQTSCPIVSVPWFWHRRALYDTRSAATG